MQHRPNLYRLPNGSERNTAAGVFVGSLVGILASLLAVLWLTTQWAAWRFGFQPALGAPLVALSPRVAPLVALAALALTAAAVVLALNARTRPLSALAGAAALAALVSALAPIYAPWDFFVWELRFSASPESSAVFRTGHWLVGVPAHFVFLVGLVVAVRRARRLGGRSDLHGSARWACDREVEAAALLGREGIYVGLWQRGKRLLPLRHSGSQHVLGFAPSRSGKGVGWVIPTLLTWPHSVLVNDVKGENWALTAGFRQGELGSRCLRFDPTCSDRSAARYNPLLEVRSGPFEVRDVQTIADMLVDPDGHGAKDHWDLTAQELLAGTMLHVLYAHPEKSLRGCLDYLTDPSRTAQESLERMLGALHDPDLARGWREPGSGKPTPTHPAVARAARSLLNKSENERSSVLSSATKFLSLFHDDVVAANTSACDFRISDLVEHARPVSLYLTVPPSDLSRTRSLIRLLIQQIGRRLTEELHVDHHEAGAPRRRRLLLLMDEFPTLGRLDFFQSQLSYLPGYGIQAFLIVQDLSQLYAAYGRDESIVSNCHVRVAFAPNRVETARLLSDMAGAMTVHKESRTYTGNRLNPVLMHVLASEQESHRALLTPDEAMRLPEDAALVFAAGTRPILATKLRYFENAELARRSAIPAPRESDRIEVAVSPGEEVATLATPTAPRAAPSLAELATPDEPRTA